MTLARAFILAGIAAALLPGSSISEDFKFQGYVVDSDPNGNVVTSGTGLCWHTSLWTPELGLVPCDAGADKKVEAPAVPQTTEPPQIVEAPVPAPEPAPPQAEPEPEPAPATTRALETDAQPHITSLPTTVNYSADAFFDFDEFMLKPEGKIILDKLVRELANVNFKGILVTGHTDRIGTAEYNQTLSERRARAVKRYLVGKGVPENSIETEGKGQTEPATKPGACKGPKSPRVVACLQADRRVDVLVAGTKTETTGSR